MSSMQAQPAALGGRAITLDPLDSLGLADGGNFEPAETALCQALIRVGDQCLDVGANIGYFTLLLSQLTGPDGYVTALEPDPANYAILATNCAPEVSAGRMTLLEAALGEAEDTARLFMSKDNTGMHRLYPSVCCTDAWHEVQVQVGDALDLPRLDFIKIDIEGYEPAALAGLTKTIQRSPSVRIMGEFSPLSMLEAGFSPSAFVRQMTNLGLRPWAYNEHGWKPLAPETLLQQLSVTETIDLASMTAPVKHQGNAAVVQAASNALAQVSYQRPLLETMLWESHRITGETHRLLAAANLAATP